MKYDRLPRSAWRDQACLCRLAAVLADPPENRDYTDDLRADVRRHVASLRAVFAKLEGRHGRIGAIIEARDALSDLAAATVARGEGRLSPDLLLRTAVDLAWSLDDLEHALDGGRCIASDATPAACWPPCW